MISNKILIYSFEKSKMRGGQQGKSGMGSSNSGSDAGGRGSSGGVGTGVGHSMSTKTSTSSTSASARGLNISSSNSNKRQSDEFGGVSGSSSSNGGAATMGINALGGEIIQTFDENRIRFHLKIKHQMLVVEILTETFNQILMKMILKA